MKRLLLLASLLLSPFAPAAVLFDGSDDIIGFGTAGDAIFTENGAASYACRFFAISDGETSAGVFMRRGGIILRINATSAIRFSTAGGLIRLSVNNAFSTNIWNHFVFTWDGSTNAANAHFYVNGAEVSYATTTNGSVPADNSADTLNIGNNTTLVGTFDGQLTEVAVWSSVLSAENISALFYGKLHLRPESVSYSTLLAHWPLDDFANGATVTGVGMVKDIGPFARHGTATNSPVAKAVEQITYP